MSQTAEQLQRIVQQALAEFERLSSSEQPPTAVVQQLLSAVARVTQAQAAIAWMPDASGTSFRPLSQVGSRANIVGSPDQPDPAALQIVTRAAKECKPFAVGPEQGEFQGSPLHPLTQFYVPIDALGRIVGVLHVIVPGELDPKVYRQYVSFAQQGARAAATYFSRRQSQLLRDDAAVHANIVKLMHNLLGLERPEHVVHELANHARSMVQAQRVAVVGYWRGGSEVAFSDTIEVNRRAVVVRTVQMLADQVRSRGVPMSFVRGQKLEGEDEQLMPLLEQVYEMGGGEAISLTPLRCDDHIIGVMICEYPDRDSASRRSASQQELCHQAGPVLQHAIRWHTRPLRRTSNVLTRIAAKPVATSLRALAVAAAVGAVIGVLFFVPVPLEIRGDARLEPATLAAASAPHTGRITEILVETGDAVQAGQVLARLDDGDFRLRRQEALAAIAAEQVKIGTARQKGEAAAVRASELRIEQHQLRIESLERKIERCEIRSLVAGTVLTENLEQLVGNTVAEGDLLVQVADLKQFDLVIEVLEADLALIEQSLRDGRPVPVDFLSHPWPDDVQHATISNLTALSPTSGPSDQHAQQVFRITVPIELEGLSPQLVLANPSGRAKLDAGPGSIAYRYGRGVWRFIQMTLLF